MPRIHRFLGTLCAPLLALAPAARVASLPCPASPSARPPAEGPPAGLREAWEAFRMAPRADGSGLVARNPSQAWTTRFEPAGARTEPDQGGWSWGLELLRYGRAEERREADAPTRVRLEGARVVYERAGGVEEWYVNDARGLEHGFTLREPPLAAAAGGALTLLFAVRGTLDADVAEGGRDVRFVDAGGTARVAYTGLRAWDADGRALAAGFERADGGLRLAVDERGARYPIVIDPLAQQAYLKASNSNESDAFGASLAVSGNTAVIGAAGEDSGATGVGGDQASNSASGAGAAYVFVREGSVWSQQAYLKASNTNALDAFGQSVAISGDTIVVGAPSEDSVATGINGDQGDNGAAGSGAAYVFVRSGTTWSQQAYLKPSNTNSSDTFGQTVGVSGDTIVVGAPGEDGSSPGVNGNEASNDLQGSGAAYVFVRNGTTWSQQAYLKAVNPDATDAFGQAVAVAQDLVVIGAPSEDGAVGGVDGDPVDNNASGAGAAYVFARSGTTWSQEAYLKASNPGSLDGFGTAVSVWALTVLVGSPGEDGAATGVNGDQSSNGASNSGAAYVFVRGAGGWEQEAYLKASNTGSSDRFGSAVALSTFTAVVGAPDEDGSAVGPDGDGSDNSASSSGAVYVFTRAAGAWEVQTYVKASNTGGSDQLGLAVSVADEVALAGAPGEDSSSTGVNGDQASNAASSAGAAYALRICPRASVVFRTAGTNPASYAAAPIVLGRPFTATVDNALAGQTGSVLFAYESATSFPLPGGQVLLCLDQGGGELFTGAYLHPVSSVGGVDGYALAVPGLLELDGAVIHTQAIQFGRPPFVLSNAQDLTLGAF